MNPVPADILLMQRLTRAALWGVPLVLLAGALLWLAQHPRFDLRRIEVRTVNGEAPRHVSEATLRAAFSGPLRHQLKGTFFTLRLTDARAAFEAVPWVAQASVRRLWPDRLRVTIEEHRAIGLWSDGRVLSSRGLLFAANAAEAELDGRLVAFRGPASFAEAAALRWADFSRAVEPLSLVVRSVEVDERAAWSFSTWSDAGAGPVFELGRDEPSGRFGEQLSAITHAWPTVLAQLERVPTRIDARYANGFTAAPMKADLTRPASGRATTAAAR